MQTTTHAIAAPRRGRFVGLLLALLLQAGFVWVLVSGLTLHDIAKILPPPIQGVFVPKAPTTSQPPLQAQEQQPQRVYAPNPDFQIADDHRGDGGITPTDNRPQTHQGPADSGPFGIAATHTTPPYPPMEQRLGHQGTVILRLTISPQGAVVDAAVVRSSGYERLDEVARAWVLAQWRYRPAVRGGVAVPASGTVSVTFDLRQAG